jgi:hypothetical protein
MIRLVRARPGIAVLSFDLRCATPVLPAATGRNVSSPPRSLPKQAFNATRQQTASTEIPTMLKECVSDHGHERMTMEALPGSSLEMIMTNLPHISWVNCVVLAERQAAQEKPCHDKVIRSRSAFVKLPP